MKQEIAFYRKE